jgi:hypothetical protein
MVLIPRCVLARNLGSTLNLRAGAPHNSMHIQMCMSLAVNVHPLWLLQCLVPAWVHGRNKPLDAKYYGS